MTFSVILALFVVVGSQVPPIFERGGPGEGRALEATLVVLFTLLGLSLLPALLLAWAGLLRSAFKMTRAPRWLARTLERVEGTTSVSPLRQVSARTWFSGLGAFLGLPLLMSAAIALLAWFDDRSDTRLFVSTVVLGAIAVALVVPDFLRRGRDVRRFLEDIDRLEGTLQRSAATGTTEEPGLSVQDWNRVVQMERAQSARDRAQAVTEGLRERASDAYSVVKSRSLVETLASLDPSLRIRIEEEVDALRRAPRREDAVLVPASGQWRLRVPDTNVELAYAVDEDRHRLHLEAIGRPADA